MAVNINSVTLSDATGYLTKFGSYIQKKSKLKVKVNATSTNGTIDYYGYRITVNGATYYVNDITTDVLKTSGTNTIIIQVFDSKGASASTTRTINVTAYDTPVISNATVIRCNADGTANKTGAYAKATIGATCTSLTGNTYAYRIKYKKKKDTTYTSVAFTGTGATINESKIISGIDVNSSYDFLFEAQDYMSLSSKIKTLGTKFVIFNVLANALGVAFGKKAEYQDTFEIGYGNTILSKNVYMAGNKTNDEEKALFFNSKTDATYQHNSYIYGGSGTSPVAIGIYDGKNGLRVFSYDDTTKEIVSGATSFSIANKKVLTTEDIDKEFSTVNENGVASTLLVMDIKYDYLDVYCTDSGWQTLTLGSDFAAYSSTTIPKYRKVGKVVEVCGVLKPTATITGSATQYTIATLPAGFRPTSSQVTLVCQGSGQSVWTLTIPTTGVMTFSRYRSGATLTDATTDAWLPFQATFTV